MKTPGVVKNLFESQIKDAKTGWSVGTLPPTKKEQNEKQPSKKGLKVPSNMLKE